MRAGDHVLHEPSGETWVVAFVDGDELAPCGYPFGYAKVSDCKLVKSCTLAEHVDLIQRLARLGESDPRGRYWLHAKIDIVAHPSVGSPVRCDFSDNGACVAKTPEACICNSPGYKLSKTADIES